MVFSVLNTECCKYLIVWKYDMDIYVRHATDSMESIEFIAILLY